MMEIIIEIKNQEILPLLKELEKMQWISFKTKDDANPPAPLSEQFAGKLSDKTAELLHQNIDEARNEWSRNF